MDSFNSNQLVLTEETVQKIRMIKVGLSKEQLPKGRMSGVWLSDLHLPVTSLGAAAIKDILYDVENPDKEIETILTEKQKS